MDGFDPDFQTNSGSKLFVAAGRPTANTAAAFHALTWVEVGAIASMGDVVGATSNTATAANISTGMNLVKKASSTRPQADFSVLLVEDDPGQIMVRSYADPENYSINSYKVVRQNLAERCFTAQAMSATETASGIDDAVMFGFSLLRQSKTVMVAPPTPVV